MTAPIGGNRIAVTRGTPATEPLPPTGDPSVPQVNAGVLAQHEVRVSLPQGVTSPTPPPVDLDTVNLPLKEALMGVSHIAEGVTGVTESLSEASEVADNLATVGAEVSEVAGKMTRGQRLDSFTRGMDGVGRAAGIASLPFAVSELLKAVHPTLNVGEAASALGDVMFGLTQAANATKGIYGVGAVLSAAELVQDIQAAVKQGSVTPGELVGMLGNALTAVGGAMAVFPPTAPLGAALVAGGAAIGLGTLVVENWDGIKAGAAVAANAVTEKTQVVAQKAQEAVKTVAQAAPVAANEVRRAVASGAQKLTRTLASGAQAVTQVIPRPVRQKLASTAQAVGTTVKRNLGNFQAGVTQALGWLGLTPRAAR